jgi:hypothetical protein
MTRSPCYGQGKKAECTADIFSCIQGHCSIIKHTHTKDDWMLPGMVKLEGLSITMLGEKCFFAFGRYTVTENIRIDIVTEGGELMLHATVNHPDYKIDDSYVMIKDYSENTGIDKKLQAVGLIGDPVEHIKVPYALFELLKKPEGFERLAQVSVSKQGKKK